MIKVIVVGNGMVGYKFCEKFITKKGSENYQITVFGEESRRAYDRVHLSEYFGGKSADDLSLSTSTWYEENNIVLNTSELVLKIDKENKTIQTHLDKTYAYDYLVLATGSAAFVPPIEGVDKDIFQKEIYLSIEVQFLFFLKQLNLPPSSNLHEDTSLIQKHSIHVPQRNTYLLLDFLKTHQE